MKSTGIVRKVDELGRIVIPREIRNKFEIAEKDPLEIYVDGTSIIIKKYVVNCILCGNLIILFTYKDRLVCPKCIEKISTLEATLKEVE